MPDKVCMRVTLSVYGSAKTPSGVWFGYNFQNSCRKNSSVDILIAASLRFPQLDTVVSQFHLLAIVTTCFPKMHNLDSKCTFSKSFRPRNYVELCTYFSSPDDSEAKGLGLHLLDCWDCGFESR